MKALIMYQRRPGEWAAPAGGLHAELVARGPSPFYVAMETSTSGEPIQLLLPGEDGPSDLWLAKGNEEGSRLIAAPMLHGWKRGVQVNILLACLPSDLGGSLLLWGLDSEEDLVGGDFFSMPLAELLSGAESALKDPEFTVTDRALFYRILSSRANAEALFAQARAYRIAQRAATIAAKD